MLRRPQVEPFLRERNGLLEVAFLEDTDGKVTAFLARLLRLTRRLEGRSRATVREALRRQERRVRDARRLSGIARTLLSASRFRPPPGAERAPEVRSAVFAARGGLWPPVPGDERRPYERAAVELDLTVHEVERLLYADEPDALLLERAPRFSPAALLRRYNLDLARSVLMDAEELEVRARGGWRDLLAAVRLARLMYRLEPAGKRSYRLVLTGPAAPFVTRPRRYGARLARVVPALTRAPGWSLEALVHRGERRVPFRLASGAPVAPPRPRRPRFDSSWERDLAREFREKIGDRRKGWTLHREETPVPLGEELFLPDFTLRHRDGRVALVEIVGFWTPGYLADKVRKVREAELGHLVLVVFRGLAAFRDSADGGDTGEGKGGETPAVGGVGPEAMEALPGEVVWFRDRIRIGPVMEAVERVARTE